MIGQHLRCLKIVISLESICCLRERLLNHLRLIKYLRDQFKYTPQTLIRTGISKNLSNKGNIYPLKSIKQRKQKNGEIRKRKKKESLEMHLTLLSSIKISKESWKTRRRKENKKSEYRIFLILNRKF